MTYEIAASYVSVLQTFNEFCEDIMPCYAYELQVPYLSWQEELGRLRLWGANIGAYEGGENSVDYILRDSSHISHQVRKILVKLGKAIREANDIILEEEQEGNTADFNIGTTISTGVVIEGMQYTSIPFLNINNDDDDDDEDGSTTELQQLFQYVETLITCLYKICTLFYNPAAHDRLMLDTHRKSPPEIEHIRGVTTSPRRHLQMERYDNLMQRISASASATGREKPMKQAFESGEEVEVTRTTGLEDLPHRKSGTKIPGRLAEQRIVSWKEGRTSGSSN